MIVQMALDPGTIVWLLIIAGSLVYQLFFSKKLENKTPQDIEENERSANPLQDYLDEIEERQENLRRGEIEPERPHSPYRESPPSETVEASPPQPEEVVEPPPPSPFFKVPEFSKVPPQTLTEKWKDVFLAGKKTTAGESPPQKKAGERKRDVRASTIGRRNLREMVIHYEILKPKYF